MPMQPVMTSAQITAAIARFVDAILAEPTVVSAGLDSLAIVGIRSRGEVLAERIAGAIAQRVGKAPDVGAMDISFYRDDFATRSRITIPRGTVMNFSVDGRVVFLVDDVLHTGRSVRAALDALVDFGRPSIIRLVTLIDRPGREVPIAAELIGLSVTPAANQKVIVHLMPTDDEDAVYLEGGK